MRVGAVTLVKEIPIIDRVIEGHAADLAADLMAYRNHTYRVVNFCVALFPTEFEQLEKLATAAVFHDLGIWTHHTFDYLKPSVEKAMTGALLNAGLPRWQVDGLIEDYAHYRRGEASAIASGVQDATGVQPHSF